MSSNDICELMEVPQFTQNIQIGTKTFILVCNINNASLYIGVHDKLSNILYNGSITIQRVTEFYKMNYKNFCTQIKDSFNNKTISWQIVETVVFMFIPELKELNTIILPIFAQRENSIVLYVNAITDNHKYPIMTCEDINPIADTIHDRNKNQYIIKSLFEYVLHSIDKHKLNTLLCGNPNITWEIVQGNPQYDWDYYGLSRNPNITWQIVQDNPKKPWDYEYLSRNPNITWEIVKDNPEKLWDYDYLSANPNITWEIVQDNPHIDWDYSWLSINPNITWEIVNNNPQIQWNYSWLSRNPNITLLNVLKNCIIDDENTIKLHCKSPEDIPILSKNPNLTWKMVQNAPHKNWDFFALSSNPCVNLQIVNTNPKKPWSYSELSKNPNITWEHFTEISKLKFKWNYLNATLNPNITTDIILKYPDLDWDYSKLHRNPNITWNIINKCIEDRTIEEWCFEEVLLIKK